MAESLDAGELQDLALQLQNIVSRLQNGNDRQQIEPDGGATGQLSAPSLRRVGSAASVGTSDGESTDAERARFRANLYPHKPKRRVALLDAERRLFFDLDALKLDDYS